QFTYTGDINEPSTDIYYLPSGYILEPGYLYFIDQTPYVFYAYEGVVALFNGETYNIISIGSPFWGFTVEEETASEKIAFALKYSTWANGASVATITLYRVNTSQDTNTSVVTGNEYCIARTSENYDAVAGYIAKFVNNYGANKNKHIHPFFARYAVRLYDDTLCNLSVPVLLVPNSSYAPFVYTSISDEPYPVLSLFAFVADVLFRLRTVIDETWKDIVQSVDIFFSKPIYPYMQGNEYDETDDDCIVFKDYSVFRDDLTGMNYGYGNRVTEKGTVLNDEFEQRDLFELIKQEGEGINTDLSSAPYFRITQISPKTNEEIDEEIRNVANFYLVKKISFDDLGLYPDLTDLTLERGVLSSLEAREALSEDNVAYTAYSECSMFSYNSRLHIFGGTRGYPAPTLPASQMQYMNAGGGPLVFLFAFVLIRTNEGVKVAKTGYSEDDLVLYYNTGFVWLFYPDNRAYKIILCYNDDSYISLPLSEHELLNGALFFLRTDGGMTSQEFIDKYSVELSDEELKKLNNADTAVSLTSIYVSEVNNPFVFRNSTAVTAGSGQILAMSCAAQAMSQGQFGQYPLYVFTDEGVWALSVDSTGVYGTSQPFTRDVVTNVDSITQLDGSVLFVTNRGIMEIAGSSVTCLTDDIDGDFGTFNPLDLPYFADFCAKALGYDDEAKTSFEAAINTWAEQSFFTFIQTARMVYDYVHQRIIVYNTDSAVAYVYSLKSKEWSLMFSKLRYTINSYPDALALKDTTDPVCGDVCEMVDMSEYATDGTNADDMQPTVFVTRPFKLDAPDIFKTVDSIVQRGYFQQSIKENHVIGTVLYGSPDLFNWFIVAQSATTEQEDGTLSAGHRIDKIDGSPYKYFRVAVFCRLGAKENICGCSLLYTLRDNNQLR
ncbi:MAG: hypothetical protein LUC22_04500, partial [Prevotella sp.]|nr:hypothetical protein [Prevotella sp.]